MDIAAIDHGIVKALDRFVSRMNPRVADLLVLVAGAAVCLFMGALVVVVAGWSPWMGTLLAVPVTFAIGRYLHEGTPFWLQDRPRMISIAREARRNDRSHRLWSIAYLVVFLGGAPFLVPFLLEGRVEAVAYLLACGAIVFVVLREYLVASHPAHALPARQDQDGVAGWCRKHYPGETQRQMVRNLVEEVGELAGELEHDVDDLVAVLRKSMSRGREGTPEALRGEIGDVMISTYNLADKLGENADDCLDAKMGKLVGRTPAESLARVARKQEIGLRKGLGEE